METCGPYIVNRKGCRPHDMHSAEPNDASSSHGEDAQGEPRFPISEVLK